MAKMIESEQQFNEIISSGVTFVDFYADWCPPCKMMAPVVDKLAEKYHNEITVVKVDVDNTPSIANRFSITGIPTFLVFKDGDLVDSLMGAMPYETIEEKIKKAIGK